MAIQQCLNELYARETGFSGPQILDFFSQYSMDIESYPWSGGAPSRWQIFEDCLAQFTLDQQKKIIADLLEYDGPMSHGRPSNEGIEKIRQWIGQGPTPVTVTPQATAALNWATVNREWRKAVERIQEDPPGVITSARSLLESVCIHVLEERSIAFENTGDLQPPYRAVARALDLSPDQQAEDVFRQVLGGCATIANGLTGMRNRFGDAHGRGGREAEAAIRHARLAVNAACSVALFLIETHLE